MKKIVLVSCASKKMLRKARAEELYISSLFKLNIQFAKKLKPDGILILSAKYGLLDMNDEIEPYDVTLNNMLAIDRKSWAKKVLKQMGTKTFSFLCQMPEYLSRKRTVRQNNPYKETTGLHVTE